MGSIQHELKRQPRLLFVDAFDSFSNNIVGLLEQSITAQVTLVHINDENLNANLEAVLSRFDAVVVGPGPGHPSNPDDVGFVNRLWSLPDEHILPIFGICLGFQSMCINHGGEVKKLKSPRHGIISQPIHCGSDIFSGVENLEATQYHSLHAILDPLNRDDISWKPSKTCPSLCPLSWDISDSSNGPILMGVRHTTKPFWGVQFHPESICTSAAGQQLMMNWWARARDWLYLRGRYANRLASIIKDPSQNIDPIISFNTRNDSGINSTILADELAPMLGAGRSLVRWAKHPLVQISPTGLLEALGHNRNEVVLLDSQNTPTGRFSIIGITLPGKTLRLTYHVTDRLLRYGCDPNYMHEAHLNSIDEVWPMLQDALDLHDPRSPSGQSDMSNVPPRQHGGMDQLVAGQPPTDSPFWGGFMGYISYEAGLETIDVAPPQPSDDTNVVPDINLAFIHRSIVIDHTSSKAYVQSLLPDDWAWILNIGRTMDTIASHSSSVIPRSIGNEAELSTIFEVNHEHDETVLDEKLSQAHVVRPKSASYRAKVRHCQEFLASGDSYELCLTDESEIVLSGDTLDGWALYRRLRRNNPAPFGAFLRLGGTLVVGSSPERFLSWTRGGLCQFRPIKGTVKKNAEGMTRELAHAILSTSKERAENLMIVDLIRHDLAGVVGAANTWVAKLMVVEEYETVYQLVSVIEGQLPNPLDSGLSTPSPSSESPLAKTLSRGPRGLDVLRASLPPGSMTGAPKKRSCEILRGIEQRPRGVYSGVLGYLDVGGGGDFSVVIRTAVRASSPSSHIARKSPFRHNEVKYHTKQTQVNGDRLDVKQNETWRIGAGGAVTIQSTDEGEFLEMETKASSVMSGLLPAQNKESPTENPGKSDVKNSLVRNTQQIVEVQV